MDFLAAQATSVPCERVFSGSAETDVKKRNRLCPLTQEALQMLKYTFKGDALNFMLGWVTPDELMALERDYEDLLADLARAQPNRTIAATASLVVATEQE